MRQRGGGAPSRHVASRTRSFHSAAALCRISVGCREEWARPFGTGRRLTPNERRSALAASADRLLASRFAIGRQNGCFAAPSCVVFPSPLGGISGRLPRSCPSPRDTCDLSALFFAPGGGGAAAGR